MAILYRINNWSEHFENNRTRDLNRMTFACIPNKQDGDGYTELIDHPNGTAHYGAWIALVLVASKQSKGVRGILRRDSGQPHDARTLARMTRIPESIIAEALPRLVEIGWLTLEVIGDNDFTTIPQAPAEIPHPPAGTPPTTTAPTCVSHACAEWNGMEGIMAGKYPDGRGKPGPKKGYKQSAEHVAKRIQCGPDHPRWIGNAVTAKGGRSRAQRKYKVIPPCEACGATKSERHHVDGNTANNEPNNIAILCRRRHMDADGRLKEFIALARRNQPKAAAARWA